MVFKKVMILFGLAVFFLICLSSFVAADASFDVCIINGSTDNESNGETLAGVENWWTTAGMEYFFGLDKSINGSIISTNNNSGCVNNFTGNNIYTSFFWNATYNVMNSYDYNYSSLARWKTLSNNSTTLNLSDDALSEVIDMGFQTDFYYNNATNYSLVRISSNGFVTFTDTNHGCCAGQDLPDAIAPNDLIAGWWEDLLPASAGGSGTIKYETITEYGQKWFIVQYYKVAHYDGGNGSNPVTFQIAIQEKK